MVPFSCIGGRDQSLCQLLVGVILTGMSWASVGEQILRYYDGDAHNLNGETPDESYQYAGHLPISAKPEQASHGNSGYYDAE